MTRPATRPTTGSHQRCGDQPPVAAEIDLLLGVDVRPRAPRWGAPSFMAPANPTGEPWRLRQAYGSCAATLPSNEAVQPRVPGQVRRGRARRRPASTCRPGSSRRASRSPRRGRTSALQRREVDDVAEHAGRAGDRAVRLELPSDVAGGRVERVERAAVRADRGCARSRPRARRRRSRRSTATSAARRSTRRTSRPCRRSSRCRRARTRSRASSRTSRARPAGPATEARQISCSRARVSA